MHHYTDRIAHTTAFVTPVVEHWLERETKDRSKMQHQVTTGTGSTSITKWCNKGCGMCYPVCGMVHIKEPLLLIDKRVAYVAAAGFLSHYQNGP